MAKQKRNDSASWFRSCLTYLVFAATCYFALIGCTAVAMRLTGTPAPKPSETPSETPAYIYILPTAAVIVTETATVIVTAPAPTATDQPNACNISVSGFEPVFRSCQDADLWIQTWKFNYGWCLYNQRITHERRDLRGIDAYCRGERTATPSSSDGKPRKSKKSNTKAKVDAVPNDEPRDCEKHYFSERFGGPNSQDTRHIVNIPHVQPLITPSIPSGYDNEADGWDDIWSYPRGCIQSLGS